MRFVMTSLLAIVVTTVPVKAQETQAEAAIHDVLANYVQGWREADPDRLGHVFDPAGSVLWTSADSVGAMTFAEILARESRPQPEYGLDWSVESLSVVDDRLAVAQVDISRKGGSYLDVLVLYNVAGSWRIVSKTFVSRTD